MRSSFAVVTALAVLAATSSAALADLSYSYAVFGSSAYAWTDAGFEYAYEIDEAEALFGPGVYTFNQYGSAPGYSSSASVGVEHDSTLSATGFTLKGKAYGYVADDVGYAACSADSYASVYMEFSLDAASRVTINGTLALGGTGTPDGYYSVFELRNASNQVVLATTGQSEINFNKRLPAGTYTLHVISAVSKSIDFSGGDVYESVIGTYDLTFAARRVRR